MSMLIRKAIKVCKIENIYFIKSDMVYMYKLVVSSVCIYILSKYVKYCEYICSLM